METQVQDTIDYIGFVKRRKNFLLIPFLTITIFATLVALLLPPVYKSSSTILVEGQQIPSELVRSTVTTVVEEAIQVITQQVMSRRKLLDIINRFSLYQDRRNKETSEEIVEKMREDIQLETINADVIDQRTGRASIATIAFNLSYQGKDPEKVQKVANVLASLYLEQNLKDREEKAKTTSTFIGTELKSLEGHINQLEIQIAEFKKKHFHSLPEMAQLNLQMVQRLEQELTQMDQQIKNSIERKIYLGGQLASVDPDLPGIKAMDGRYADAKQQLEFLTTEYISLKASLSEKHPDLIKMKKEIESLGKEVNLKQKIEIKQNQLEKMKSDLASKQATFSIKHPDIIKLKKSIKILGEEIKVLREKKTDSEQITGKPENPVYINLQTQIATADMDIQSLKTRQEEIRTKLNDYLKRLELTPQIEREYQFLTRDYENARIRYRETSSKLMEAKTAEELEKTQKGQKFTIIDPAIYPEKPFKPNRLAIILIGFILGLGGGVGAASLKEFSDQSIHSETFLANLAKKPVLAVIPLIVTDSDIRDKKLRAFIVITILGISFILAVLAIHLFYMPLDIIWFKVLRRVG